MDKKKRNRVLLIITTIIIVVILLLLLVKCSTNKPKQEITKQEETTTEVTKTVDNTTQENKQEEVIVEPSTPAVEEKKEETNDITQMYFWVVFYDQYGNELQREALKYGTTPEYKGWLPEGFDKWDKDIKSIVGNTYYHAQCHEVHHSSGGGSNNTPSNPPQSMPVQGDIIKLNDNKTYRVLKVSGNCVKVLGMEDANSDPQCYHATENNLTTSFIGTPTMMYQGSDLDNFLNITWYGSLPAEMKNAIQPTPVVQNGYDIFSGPDLTSFTGDIKLEWGFAWPGSYDGLISKGTLTVGNRNVWAIDISEIADYLENVITSSGLIEMFFNQTTATSTTSKVLLSSSQCFMVSTSCFAVQSDFGSIVTNQEGMVSSFSVRATFVIDLSYPGVTYTIQ